MATDTGLGSPAKGDFSRFGEESDSRVRASMLDEALNVFAGLTSGSPFDYQGKHYQVGTVHFTPPPVQRPRIPVWVGGVLPSMRPMDRAAMWDGAVPIRFADRQVVRPSTTDIASVRDHVAARRPTMDDFDLAVWSEVAESPGARRDQREAIHSYEQAGATWWIETGRPLPGWWDELKKRVSVGP